MYASKVEHLGARTKVTERCNYFSQEIENIQYFRNEETDDIETGRCIQVIV